MFRYFQIYFHLNKEAGFLEVGCQRKCQKMRRIFFQMSPPALNRQSFLPEKCNQVFEAVAVAGGNIGSIHTLKRFIIILSGITSIYASLHLCRLSHLHLQAFSIKLHVVAI